MMTEAIKMQAAFSGPQGNPSSDYSVYLLNPVALSDEYDVN